jgi:lipid II:glycine glycyltransferase (peptidoglycan interpeptide bridge formation enzyme)
MLVIRQIQNKEEWEAFNLSQNYTLFVQSYLYGEFYKSIGESYLIFGIYDGEKLIGGSLILTVHAMRADFLYLPYGPIFSEVHNREEQFKLFFDYLKEFAKKNKYDFIRVSPFVLDSKDERKLYKKNRMIISPIHILAEETWILDLSKHNLDGLLKDMKKNHRNLINRCKHEKIRVEKTQDPQQLVGLNNLLDATAKRHKFTRFSEQYIKNEFKIFAEQNQACLYNAYLPDGSLDSSAIIIIYKNMAVYRHSASKNTDKRLPTSYALQWQVIQDLKSMGIKYYNFWGISPKNAGPEHPFYGITHFKKGFGGNEYDLLWCRDMPISIFYWLNWIIEYARCKWRGF